MLMMATSQTSLIRVRAFWESTGTISVLTAARKPLRLKNRGTRGRENSLREYHDGAHGGRLSALHDSSFWIEPAELWCSRTSSEVAPNSPAVWSQPWIDTEKSPDSFLKKSPASEEVRRQFQGIKAIFVGESVFVHQIMQLCKITEPVLGFQQMDHQLSGRHRVPAAANQPLGR